MSARDKLLSRKPKPIEIDGEQVFARALTIRESLDAEKLAGDHRAFVFFVLSRAITEEDGTPVFSGESDDGLNDIPMDRASELVKAVTSLTQTGKPKALEKNSDATLSSAS